MPTTARATQHLIEPGSNWDNVVDRAQPGDEILLMPGTHQAATLRNLAGTADQPIVIRSLDPQNPSVFREQRIALTLIDPLHVVVENLSFERIAMTAIIATSDPTPRDSDADSSSQRFGNLVLRNLHITNTGPDDNVRVIVIRDLKHVTIEKCTFTGWSGRAMELINADAVTVQQCTFTGVEKYDAELAIAIRAGTKNSTISKCTFTSAGNTAAISLGGKTKLSQLPNLPDDESTHKPVFEAIECRVINSTFIDQPCPVILAHVDRCAVRQCTIVRPHRWVCALLTMHDDPRVAPSNRPTFADNLIVWDSGNLTGLFLVDANSRDVTLILGSNLWWSNETVAVRQRMIPTIIEEAWPQVVDTNPHLNDELQPTNANITVFGAVTP